MYTRTIQGFSRKNCVIGLMIYTPTLVYVTLLTMKIMFHLIYLWIVDLDLTNHLLIFHQLQKQVTLCKMLEFHVLVINLPE